MKFKSSYIFKALTALVLALLMVFGTVATSMAAVVDDLADSGVNADLAESGGYNWNANIFFRVPDGWNLSTYPNVQAWAVQSTSASSGTKYAYLLGNMSVAGTTSNSRLYHAWVSVNHSPWGTEYIAFTANTSNWGTGDFYISTCGQYTKPLSYGATNSSGAYLFSPSDASNNTASNNNTISGSYNGTNRDVLKKNQDFYVYTSGAASATGGKVEVTAHYVNGSSYSGSSAIASSSITVDSNDSGAHEQYGGAVEGTKVTLTATANTGYDFAGFYDAATGGNQLSSSTSYSYYVFGAKSVYARYTPKTYTITYNKGANGTGSVSSTTKTHGVTATLSSSTFTRTGYTQTGWSTSDGGAKSYDLGGSYTTNASTTLYPYWTQNTYTVKKSETGGTGTVMVGSTTITTGGVSIAHGTYTVTIDAPNGYNVSAVSGITGTTSGLNTSSVTITGVSITAAKTISVTYESAGTCGFTLDKSSTTLNIGATDTFTATPNSFHTSGTISAASSNEGVATVSKSGNTYTVTAVSHGTATITVSCTEGGSATFNVTVSAPTISIALGSSTRHIGETTTITPTVTNQGTATITYSSSDTSVATISGNTITAKAPGTTNITATVDGVTSTAKTLTVDTPSLTLTYNPSSIYVGGSSTNTPTVTANNVHSGVTPTNLSYTVTSGGSSGSVNSSGVVTSTSTAGTVTVKVTGKVTYNGVTYNNAQGTANVTVKNRETVYLLGLTNDYTWTATDSGDKANKMTYNSTTGLYEKTFNLYSGSTTYNGDNGFKLYVGSSYYGKNSTTLTTSSNSASGLSTSGGNIYLTTKDLSSVTSNKVPYKFTYDTDSKTVTVYYPMKVTYNMQSHGTNPASNGYVVAYGSTLTAPTAPTASGYTFGGWYKEAACTNAWNFSTDTVTADTVLYAKWTANSHSVTYPTTTTGYSLGGTKPTTANYGTTVSFTVAPTSGYRIKSVKYTPAGGSATNCTAGSSNEYHFTMPDANVTVSVEAVQTYTVTVNAGTGGSVASSSLTVDAATATTLPTATPAYGYKFVNWTVTSGTATLSSATSASAAKITTSAAATVTANFAKDDGMTLGIAGRFHVHPSSGSTSWTNTFNSGNWSDTGLNSGGTAFNIPFVWDATEQKYKVETYAKLSDLTSQISSNDPYFFVYDKSASKGWHPTSNTDLTTSVKTANLTSNATTANVKFNANVADSPVIIWFDATTKTLSYTVPNFYDVTVTTPTNGTVTASPTRTTDGTTVTLTIAPSTGYQLSAITVKDSDNQNVTLSGTGNTRTFTMPAKNVTVTATFSEIRPVVTFTAYKTDNNSTYVAGGGELTATWTTSSGGSGSSSTTYPDRYLWWSASDNPAQHSNKLTMAADTDGNYYANFTTGDNFYFNINDNSSSATSGSQKLNSSTSADKDSNFQDWTTVGEWGGYYIGKGDLKTGTGVYIKFSPSENKVYFKSSAFTYTPAGGGSGGGSSSSSGTVTSGGTVPYGATVTFTAESAATVDGNTYQFIGWYSSATPVANETALSTSTTYTKTGVNDNVTVYARYKQALYLTFYNSYYQENAGDDFVFTAAPPRTVTVGMGSNVRATYSYKAGNAEQRGEEHTKNSTSDYYEGNRLLVLVGETVTLKFTTLASSDAISGIFFNNSIRYTTETEPDNLYKQRVKYTGSDPDCWGSLGDDEWDYDYAVNTTIYADYNYYSGSARTTIESNASSYVGQNNMNQSTHTISWVATQSYMNIDIELGTKYQLHINDDDWSGINIANMNDEGYYYGGETIESTSADHTNGLKITLDNTTDTTGTYSFSSTTPVWKDKNGNTVSAPSGVTVKAYTSGNAETNSAANVHHWLVYGTMPNNDLYLTIPVVKKYNIKLANIVVSDNSTNKRTMLTECSTNSTSATDSIGTISGKVNNTTQNALTSDGTYYTYPGNNHSGHVEAYTSSTNNKYLKGGVNRNGYNVSAGETVSYTFTWNSGKDAEYSFVGWFEGSYTNASTTDFSYEVDYTKKLSGKESFTFTPTKNTVVIAVATRDIYIGGNFTKDGAYTSTASSQTWSKDRPLMEFDPTYVNPENSSEKGRYYYTFDTVTANTEYQFRCYDTVGTGASGQDKTNLTVWSQWSGDDYANDEDGIFFGRHKYDAQYGYSHGAFVYKNNTNNWSLIDNTASDHDSTKNHQANGYAAPVTVYFYTYDNDGGISVSSTYQWSRAYVSEGRGIDVKSVSGGTTTYNSPTASVANKTVNNKDVVVNTNTTSYGHDGKFEKIYECLVKENNGSIVVTAQPNDENLELQAFLVYNIETKASEAVKTFTTSGEGASKQYTGNILIPNNSKIYVCPIYKFTNAYISAQNLETHNVFVRADDIDKDDWGGLVAMYSWGTTSGYDSGGWPGQLMIPSDDGTSFYAPLTFQKGGLAGVTFNNYTQVFGGDFVNFLGKYQDAGVSNVAYSGYTKSDATNNYIYQVFDYREPISIIENLNEKNPSIYDSEDMTLTFELKPGNKKGTGIDPASVYDSSSNPSGVIGNGAYNANYEFEYLTDSSGKYRVDLNGNKLSTYPTASYYVVCNYTEAYAPGGAKSYDFKDGTRDGTTTHNRYSIDWNVYDQNHVLVAKGTQLSASFTDVHKSEMLTHIAKQLIDDGQPVSGKAVMIAYENPKVSSSDNTEAVRYSGQWYADGLNTIINGNVRVGIYADGAWLPSESNSPGYATATVSFSPAAASGERLVTEDGCTGNSLAEITKIHAANGDLQFSVDSTDNFLGWYRKNKDGEFEKIGSNYLSQAINPSFNEDITFYAFYTAQASYRFKYTSRLGGDKYFTAKGTDLTEAEMSDGGILNATTRAADITAKLAKATTDITKFNYNMTFSISNADTDKPYVITYTATEAPATYTLTPYAYNSSGNLEPKTVKTGQWSTGCELPKSYVNNKPSGQSNDVFVGWIDYSVDLNSVSTSNPPVIYSTQANFGYCLSRNMQIKPFFAPAADVATYRGSGWQASIERNEITQELTDANNGTIFNDSLVNFGDKSATGIPFTIGESSECGIVVFTQSNSANATAEGNFSTNLTDAKMQTYIKYMTSDSGTSGSRELDSAKLSATYGSAIALKIKAASLSELNRIDLYQILDYATYNGGHYKVMAYSKVNGSYVFSSATTGDYVLPARS